MVELLVFAAGLTGLVAGVVLDEFSLLVCSFGMKHLESCVGGVVFLQVGAGVTGFGFIVFDTRYREALEDCLMPFIERTGWILEFEQKLEKTLQVIQTLQYKFRVIT